MKARSAALPASAQPRCSVFRRACMLSSTTALALALLLATAAAETTKEITLSNGVAMPIVAYGTWHCACAHAACAPRLHFA